MSKKKCKNVEVILTLSPEHILMIKRLAKIYEVSVEQWILEATEGSLRADEDAFSHAGLNVGFDDEEITDVINQVRGAA